MRAIILFILLSFLFTSGYALAQTCPCDTLELSNGVTGNEIIDALCPGGELSDQAFSVVEEDTVLIQSPEIGFVYGVQAQISDFGCVIAGLGVPTDGLGLNLEEYENCRARLITACGLNTRPIPTLSEWGLIAMAVILGMIGLFVAARRRKAVA